MVMPGATVSAGPARAFSQDEAGVAAALAKVTMRVIPLLFACYLLNYLDRVNVGFAKLQMLGDLRMSEATYGLGAGVFFLGYLACGVPSNLILARVGARRAIAVMMVAWGLFSTSLLLVRTPTEFYLLRFLTGAAEAGFFPGVVLYLTRWFPGARHGRVMTIFMSAIPVSGLLGGPLSGWILSRFTGGASGLAAWQWLFLLQGLPTVVLGVVIAFLLSDGVDTAPWLDDRQRGALKDALAKDRTGQAPLVADSFAELVRNGAVWQLGLVYFCIQLGVYAISFWLPSIIRDGGATTPLTIGLMSAVPYLAATLFMIAMGRSADRRRERRVHLAAPLVLGALGLGIAAAVGHHPALSLLGMTLGSMGALAGLPLFWPLANARLSAAAAVGGLALINSTGQIAGFASPYFVGLVKDATGGTGAALGVLATALLAGAVLVLRTPQPLAAR